MQARLTQFTPVAFEGSPSALTSPHMSLHGQQDPNVSNRNNAMLPKNFGSFKDPNESS